MKKLTKNQVARSIDLWGDFILTGHAITRMSARGITKEAVNTVLQFGRPFFVRGAEIYVIGRQDVKKAAIHVKKKLLQYEGLQIVCLPGEGIILTVYRNNDFKKSFKKAWS